jgi:hypothetical protein
MLIGQAVGVAPFGGAGNVGAVLQSSVSVP